MRSRTFILLLLALVTCFGVPAFAQGDGPIPLGDSPSFEFMRDIGRPAILSIVFTIIGLIFFAICFWLIIKITPFSVQKEIEEDQNTALGIIIGSMILGIAIILAAAMIG